jgi:hypothetical protein
VEVSPCTEEDEGADGRRIVNTVREKHDGSKDGPM